MNFIPMVRVRFRLGLALNLLLKIKFVYTELTVGLGLEKKHTPNKRSILNSIFETNKRRQLYSSNISNLLQIHHQANVTS